MDEALEEDVDATWSPLSMKNFDVEEEDAMTDLRPPQKMLAAEH